MENRNDHSLGWEYGRILSDSAGSPTISAMTEHCEAEQNYGWTVVHGGIEDVEQHIRRMRAAKSILYDHTFPSLTD